jgi:hypothetical protein
MVRFVFLGLFALPLVSGCAVLGPWFSRAAPLDPSQAAHRAAMADFSRCVTSADPGERLILAQRLDDAARSMQAQTRSQNPDHFHMSDRVTAAAAYCADSLR